jgi:hypothetical protein
MAYYVRITTELEDKIKQALKKLEKENGTKSKTNNSRGKSDK